MCAARSTAPRLIIAACLGLTGCSIPLDAPATPTAPAAATPTPAAPTTPAAVPPPLPTVAPPTAEAAAPTTPPPPAAPGPAQPLTLAQAMAVPDVQVLIPDIPVLSHCDKPSMSQRLLALVKTLPTAEEANAILQTGNGYPQDAEPGQPTPPPGSGPLDLFLQDRFGTYDMNAYLVTEDLALHGQVALCSDSYIDDQGNFGLTIWPNELDTTHSCGAIGYLEGTVRDGKIVVATENRYSKELHQISRGNCFSNASTFLEQAESWEIPYVVTDDQ